MDLKVHMRDWKCSYDHVHCQNALLLHNQLHRYILLLFLLLVLLFSSRVLSLFIKVNCLSSYCLHLIEIMFSRTLMVTLLEVAISITSFSIDQNSDVDVFSSNLSVKPLLISNSFNPSAKSN